MTVLTLLGVVHKPNLRGLFARSDIHRVWLLNGKTSGNWTISNGFHWLTEQTFPLAVALHLDWKGREEWIKNNVTLVLGKTSPVDHWNECSGMLGVRVEKKQTVRSKSNIWRFVADGDFGMVGGQDMKLKKGPPYVFKLGLLFLATKLNFWISCRICVNFKAGNGKTCNLMAQNCFVLTATGLKIYAMGLLRWQS